MKRRLLGRTGQTVSVLGFGGSSLGGAFGPVDEDEAVRAVRAALDLGINYFDVAPFYGLGRAETLLGRALRGVSRDRFVLSTKVGRYGERAFDFSARRARESVAESAERLGVGKLDIVLVHDIEHGDLQEIAEETLPELRALQQDGKVGAVGASGLPVDALQRLLDKTPLDVVLSYAHYHLFDTSSDLLRLGDAALVLAAPLAMGLLTAAGPPPWHPASALIRDTCARAAAHASELGLDLARLALGFALGSERAASTLVGMRTVSEAHANCAVTRQEVNASAFEALADCFRPIRGLTWR